MLSQAPEVSGLSPGLPGRLLEGRVEIEGLRPFALLTDLEAAQQIADLVFPKAGQGQIDRRSGSELGQEAGQESVVPGAADPIQRQSQDAGLLERNVEPADRDALQAQPAGCHQALVASDDRAIRSAGEDRLDKAELADAALQGVEFGITDPSGVGRIGTQ